MTEQTFLQIQRQKNRRRKLECAPGFAGAHFTGGEERAGITVVVTVTTEPATAGEMAGRSKSQNKGTSEGDKKAAETLIDKTVSREEIEETAGKWTEFELDGNGCERGVYAGKFYYEDFMIYSRTYDKGKTFHIMSVN